MIVSGYSMMLYCDGREEGRHPEYWNDQWTAEYTGETWHECARQARKQGWLISRDKTKAYCPTCAKKKRKS